MPGVKQMKRFFVCGCLNFLLAFSSLAADITITAVEKPIRLIRGVQTFKAGAGVVLQKGDILESGLSTIQIESGPGLMVAVAPSTKVYLVDVGPRLEFAVIEGWLKLRNKDVPVALQSNLMRSHSVSNSLVFHVDTGKNELFPEEGEISCAPFNGADKSPAEQKIKQEQYAVVHGGEPIKVLPRPAKEFLAAIPKPFRDALSSQAGKLNGKTVAPQLEYEIQYADVEAWLKTELPAKKDFVKRFKPMLKNPAFRSALAAELGQMPEWKIILHPPVKKSASSAGNAIY